MPLMPDEKQETTANETGQPTPAPAGESQDEQDANGEGAVTEMKDTASSEEPVSASAAAVAGGAAATADTAQPHADDGPAHDLIPAAWERITYAALFFMALAMRLWDLGARAVHHDESLHGFFSWNIFTGEGYIHNPLMHGMFLFHSTAGAFWLFGDNDFTLRLPMALFGSALVLLPLLLRSRLGQIGALAAAVMLTFSPAMLYFSRFARNDIFMAVFVLGLFAMIWRYLDERKNRYLYLIAAFLALGFTTKETMYISAFIFMIGLLFLAWQQVGNWLWGRIRIKEFDPPARLLLLLACLTIPLAGPLLAIFQGPMGVTLAATANNDLGLPTGSPGGGGWIIAIAVTVGLAALGMAVGLLWNRRAWLICWAVFALIFSVIFTNFFTHFGGIGSGIWQSLGYWLAQHGVNRGEQPWFYYFILVTVYEFLPALIALAASAWYILKGDKFTRFLVFWAAATFLAYSMAGEKMPWLLVNIALPIIILAARAINDVARSVNWRKAIESKLPLLLICVPALLVVIWRLAFFEFDMEQGARTFFSLWGLLGVAGVTLVAFYWLAQQSRWKNVLSAAGLVFVGLMFLLTVRAGWVATYVHSDVPKEMLVYTQTSPALHNLVEEITDSGNRKDIKVFIDSTSGFTWPWAWYLRDHDVHYSELSVTDTGRPEEGTAIAVIYENNNDAIKDDLAADFTPGDRIPHRWWFPEQYKKLDPGKFFRAFGDRRVWRESFDFFFYRDIGEPIGSVDSYVYFDSDRSLADTE